MKTKQYYFLTPPISKPTRKCCQGNTKFLKTSLIKQKLEFKITRANGFKIEEDRFRLGIKK